LRRCWPLQEPTCLRGEPHPRLNLVLDGIALFRSVALASALDGAELVIHAVNSEGAVPVMTKAAPVLPDGPHRGRISVRPQRIADCARALDAGVRWSAELGVGRRQVYEAVLRVRAEAGAP